MSSKLELILGPMYASKTTELIKKYNRYKAIGQKVLVVNNSMDNRYMVSKVCSHDKNNIDALFLEKLEDLYKMDSYKKCDVLLIDEGQFFDDLVEFITKSLDNDNKIIIVSGLSGDYRKKPFGHILELIPHADKITQLEALCKLCNNGTPAHFTKRIVSEESTILVGESEYYIPVCRKHFNIKIKNNKINDDSNVCYA